MFRNFRRSTPVRGADKASTTPVHGTNSRRTPLDRVVTPRCTPRRRHRTPVYQTPNTPTMCGLEGGEVVQSSGEGMLKKSGGRPFEIGTMLGLPDGEVMDRGETALDPASAKRGFFDWFGWDSDDTDKDKKKKHSCCRNSLLNCNCDSCTDTCVRVTEKIVDGWLQTVNSPCCVLFFLSVLLFPLVLLIGTMYESGSVKADKDASSLQIVLVFTSQVLHFVFLVWVVRLLIGFVRDNCSGRSDRNYEIH